MHVAGTISSVGFESGDRFVTGCWSESPIGPLVDVMWAKPDGHRTLLVDTATAADFITSIYQFDSVEVGRLHVDSDGRRTLVRSDLLELTMSAGWLRPVPFARPRAVTRHIEAPIARRLMGVECFGTSPRGAREWYQARGWRWIVEAAGAIGDESLGAMTSPRPPLRVGFSEPPERPSIVTVRVLIELPRDAAGRMA